MPMEPSEPRPLTDWPEVLEAKRLACENRLLPVMEQMNPRTLLVLQQMSRHPESAELLTIITTDPDLPLAQAVQILLNATSPQDAQGANN
ncbi:MAG: hypothetical protein ACYDB0_08305 [Acidithiobacillus sp.]